MTINMLLTSQKKSRIVFIKKLIDIYMIVSVGVVLLAVISYFAFLRNRTGVIRNPAVLVFVGLFIIYTIVMSIMAFYAIYLKFTIPSIGKIRIKTVKKKRQEKKPKKEVPKKQMVVNMQKTGEIVMNGAVKPISFARKMFGKKVDYKSEEEKLTAQIGMLKTKAQLKVLEEKKRKSEEKKKKSEESRKTKLVNSMFKDVKKSFPKIPKDRKKRLRLERDVANVVQSRNGTFTLSEVIESMIVLYNGDMENGMRNEILDEIKEWIEEDESVEIVSVEKNITHHKIVS